MATHNQSFNDPINARAHHLHAAGYVCAGSAAQAAITTMLAGDLAIVLSPAMVYLYDGTAWKLLFTGETSAISVTDPSQALNIGRYFLACGEDSSHPLVLSDTQTNTIYQTQNYTAQISIPNGTTWNDGTISPKIVGFGDVLKITLYGSMYFAEYQTSGRG